jgi:hypothetical protein
MEKMSLVGLQNALADCSELSFKSYNALELRLDHHQQALKPLINTQYLSKRNVAAIRVEHLCCFEDQNN